MKKVRHQIKRLIVFFALLWLTSEVSALSFFWFLAQADENDLVVELYIQKKYILAYFKLLAAIAFTLIYLVFPLIQKYNRFRPIYSYIYAFLLYVVIFMIAYFLGGWLMNFTS